METIKIEFQPNIKERLIDFLNSFSKTDLQIIEEESTNEDDEYYAEYRKELHLELKRIESGESKLYSIEELDAMLEETISKYES